MLDAYYDYFNSRVSEADELMSGAEDAGWLAARDVVTVAGDVANENGRSLRPDAALLISMLSYELVARPVLTVRPEQQEGLSDIIASDVRQIVTTAANLGGEEITAHAVIDALSSSWQALDTAHFEVWDGR